ncbi:MAG TPA: hypothetical protein PLD48_09310 [Bacillota bacterium]|nr:hypothetical protein [Bacillota bacterium]HOK69231.1 hypothetical protein [Bacillota bacterium]
MKSFEEEYRIKMDALCGKADVLDSIKSNAYKKIVKANKAVSRPFKSIFATATLVVLVCCFLFAVSFNLLAPSVNTSDTSIISGTADAQSSDVIINKSPLLIFGEQKPLAHLVGVYKIDERSTVYSEYPDIQVKKSDSETIGFGEALEQKFITIDDIIAKMKPILKKETINGEITVYAFEAGENDLADISFFLVKNDTIGDKNILIGTNENLLKINPDDLPHDNVTVERLSFSNTGAKTEDFIVYDGTAEVSILNGYWEGCKIHDFTYHSFTEFDIYKLGMEEDTSNFQKRFILGVVGIDGKSPVCEGFNQIQMIWDLGITPQQIEKLLGTKEEFIQKLKEIDPDGEIYTDKMIQQYMTFYMGPENTMTDEDLDAIQMAWKNDFCVYTNRAFYTLDWLYEHTAEDYLAHKLPLDQLEQIYAYSEQRNITVVVNFLKDRIAEYKELLSDSSN